MAQTCPHCGGELPAELGQHSVAPMTGLVKCPHCGADAHLAKETEASSGSEERSESAESFSGHETVEGVMGEVRDKQE
jgi:hypothetical protein